MVSESVIAVVRFRQLSLMEKRSGKPMLRRGKLHTSTSLSLMFSVRQQHLADDVESKAGE